MAKQASVRIALLICAWTQSRGAIFQFHFLFPISVLPDAARTAKRREREYQHRDGINDCKPQQPSGRAGMPLTPRGDRAVEREHAENCSSSFMKKLARRAPDDAQGDFRRVPER